MHQQMKEYFTRLSRKVQSCKIFYSFIVDTFFLEYIWLEFVKFCLSRITVCFWTEFSIDSGLSAALGLDIESTCYDILH